MKLVVRKGFGALVAALVLVCAFALPGMAMAEDLGGIGGNTTQQYDNTQNRNYSNNPSTQSNNGGNGLTDENGRNPVQQFKDNLPNDNDGSGITDYLNGYNPVDKDSMNRAQNVVSPLASVIKTVISVILVALPVILFLVSAVDMVYLTVPFSRSLLCPGGQESMSSMSGGMGGYGAGYGGGYGSGMGAQMTGSSGRKFISDDAEQALQEAQAASAGAANSSMGMQAGYGGMQEAKPAKSKSPLMIYMKKRVWMYIVFGLSLILLFSNVWLQWGAGLANWIVSLIS